MIVREKKHNALLGFTLVEIMATVFILGIMSVAVLNMYSFGRQLNGIVEKNLVSTYLFQHKIEEIKSRPFTANVTETNVEIATYPQYRFDVVQTTAYIGNPKLKKVDVTCRYTSVFGTSIVETINFLVADI